MSITRFNIANVVLEDNARARAYPELYCRTTKRIPFDEATKSFTLFPYENFEFSTYFNMLSLQKWRRYTVVDSVGLHLELKGKADITFFRVDSTLAEPRKTEVGSMKVDSDDFTSLDFDYENVDDADMLSFEVLTYGICYFHRGYYYADVDEASIRPVELSLATTTFKQEAFITANIDLFKKEIFGCDEPIANHFHMHVIDNGRTLDAEALSGEGVTVHPNKNVGGAGGFTRGMIEAMHQDPRATHVLLMDDDVQICTESFKRTFKVLSLANDEYSQAFVSGAMISYERQNEFYEDIGWVRKDGLYGPIKRRMNLFSLQDIVAAETAEIRKPHRYVGWWYCCIPISRIEECGLPLPVFIRGDDAEYGNRAAERIITMNGICIWHLTLALKYRAHLERYQVPRNSLIAQATTGVYSGVDFIEQFTHNVQLDMKTFNYDSVELSLRAMEDFLRGPSFIMEDRGETILKETSQLNEKPIDLDNIDDDRISSLVIDPQMMFDNPPRTFFEKMVDYVSYNGHRLPSFMLKNEMGVIPWDGWFYPSKRIRMRKALLAVTIDGKQGIIRTMDKARFKELNKRYKRLMKRYEAEKSSVRAAYAQARPQMTSEEFWLSYLDMR